MGMASWPQRCCTSPMAAPEAVAIPKWQVVTSWILSCLPLLAFLPSAVFKLVQPGEFLAEWSKNYPPATARPIGIIELSCVALYFVPATRVLGAILLTGYLGGAISTHVRAGQASFGAPLLSGIMLWGGLFLRRPRVRQLCLPPRER